VAFLQDQILATQGGLKRGPEATADSCAPPLDSLCNAFDDIKNEALNTLGHASGSGSFCLMICVGLEDTGSTNYLTVGGIGDGAWGASGDVSQTQDGLQGPWQGVAGGAIGDGGGSVTVTTQDPSTGNTIAWGAEGEVGEGWEVGVNIAFPISLNPGVWKSWLESWGW
jgi:hypothetical protein